MFENFPYSNFHDLNTDWIVKKIKDVETSEANAKASEEAAAGSAAAAAQSATASDQSAQASAQSAEQAHESEEYVTGARNQLDLLQARVDNIIPSGTQTEGNTELLDIRVGYNGITYPSAGDAVRTQVSDLKTAMPSLDFRLTESLESGADLNTYYDYRTLGSYAIPTPEIAASLLNAPDGLEYAGRLFVMTSQTSYRTIQILIESSQNPNVYFRYWNGSRWFDWKKMAYTDLIKISNGELLNVEWHVGSIESNGYPRESNHTTATKRILSNYIFVGQNTKISVTDSTANFNISKFDLNKTFTGVYPSSGWATISTPYVITEDCFIRIMMRRTGDPELTDEDITSLVNALKMDYYPPTANDYTNADGIPSYYNESLNSAVETIRSNMNACGQNGDTFVFITDLHWDPIIQYKNRNARRSPMLVKKIIEETGLRKIFFGGDYFTGNDSADFEFEQIRNLFNAFNIKNTLAFPIIGNHDFNGYNTTTGQWDKNTAYAQIIKQCEGYVNMGNDLCYYYDNDACNTRYIFLNTKDTHNRWSTTDSTDWTTQLAWMNTILNDTPRGYNIIIAMHIYYDVGAASTDYALSVSQQGSDVATACDTFNSQNNDKKVRVIITGHAHRDYNATTPGGIPIVMTDTDSSAQVLSGRDATWDTTGENCFDVMTIDYTNNKIKTVRIGRGGSEANRSIDLYM